MRLPSVLVALTACGAESELSAEVANPDGLQLLGATMTLESTPWVAGFGTEITVTDAPPGVKVLLLSSPNLAMAGICIAKTKPMCFDLAQPLKSLGSKTTDASGSATFTLTVPDPVSDPAVELQAVIIDRANSQKSNAVIVDEHDLGSDLDGDGLVAEDEMTVWLTDPSDPDTDGDDFFEGTEVTAGTDLLDGTDFPPTYTNDLHPNLFLVECTPCHVDGNAGGGLNLDLYGKIVNRQSNDVPAMDRVEPFDPDNSYLWHKLNGTQLAVGGAGQREPRDGPPFLTVEQMALVEDWINTGALEKPDQ